jgi:HEAT repeat protein
LADDPDERRKQLDRLVRLVRGSQSYQARRVAARLLGQSGELRVVPALIFALSDPDTTVKRFARDGLRFISRRFDGFDMPNKPNEQEMRAAQRAWKDWYLSLDPGYVFLDEDS